MLTFTLVTHTELDLYKEGIQFHDVSTHCFFLLTANRRNEDCFGSSYTCAKSSSGTRFPTPSSSQGRNLQVGLCASSILLQNTIKFCDVPGGFLIKNIPGLNFCVVLYCTSAWFVNVFKVKFTHLVVF